MTVTDTKNTPVPAVEREALAGILRRGYWSDAMVRATGLPIFDVPFVTVGGGIGSFVLVDYLRIAGVPTSHIRVLSNLSAPWHTYEHLTRVSQIDRQTRIRSDSASRPDNIWGFPSYAFQEALRDKTIRPLLQVLVEPVFADYYTPKAGIVFDALEREARRIRYWEMLSTGQVRTVRRRVGGGYFTLRMPLADDASDGPAVYRSRFVHLAIGYPGLNFLAELKRFREEHQDFHHIVNAYEHHEHVYRALRNGPRTVLVRGGGIVASQVLERLIREREEHQLQTQIIHLFRTYYGKRHGRHPWVRRKGRHGFAYQGFNYPKSVWGGQHKSKMRKLEGEKLVRAYEDMGGTSTAWRRMWQRQLARGRKAGWYRALAGTVESVQLGEDGRLVNQVHTDGGTIYVTADFVIDCTGLQADIGEHCVLRDLLDFGDAGRNVLGRLDVTRKFEVQGTANGGGRIYASGAATLGGYFPGVDTFLGLQISALEIVDDLAKQNLCKRIGPLRSTIQWLKWARNSQI